jgi:hypothetical protein
LSCGDSASLQIPPNVGRFEKARSRGRQDVPRLSPKFRALQRLLIELEFIIGIPRDLFSRGVRNLIFCSSPGTHSALKASAYRYGYIDASILRGASNSAKLEVQFDIGRVKTRQSAVTRSGFGRLVSGRQRT